MIEGPLTLERLPSPPISPLESLVVTDLLARDAAGRCLHLHLHAALYGRGAVGTAIDARRVWRWLVGRSWLGLEEPTPHSVWVVTAPWALAQPLRRRLELHRRETTVLHTDILSPACWRPGRNAPFDHWMAWLVGAGVPPEPELDRRLAPFRPGGGDRRVYLAEQGALAALRRLEVRGEEPQDEATSVLDRIADRDRVLSAPRDLPGVGLPG